MNYFANIWAGFEVPVPCGRQLDERVNVLFRDSGREISGMESASREQVVDLPDVKEGDCASPRMRASMFGMEGGESRRQRCRHMG